MEQLGAEFGMKLLICPYNSNEPKYNTAQAHDCLLEARESIPTKNTGKCKAYTDNKVYTYSLSRQISCECIASL